MAFSVSAWFIAHLIPMVAECLLAGLFPLTPAYPSTNINLVLPWLLHWLQPLPSNKPLWDSNQSIALQDTSCKPKWESLSSVELYLLCSVIPPWTWFQFLSSQHLMDYSLLVGIHDLDQKNESRTNFEMPSEANEVAHYEADGDMGSSGIGDQVCLFLCF